MFPQELTDTRAFGMALTGASTIAAFGIALALMGLGR